MSDIPPPQPQPATQATFTVYLGPPLETIRSIVASQFQVKDAFLDPNGVPTVIVTAEPTKEKFKDVLSQLADHHLLAAMRGTDDALIVKVFQKPQLGQSRQMVNLVLFLATVATVSLAGFLIWTGVLSTAVIQSLRNEYNQIVAPGVSPYFEAALFAGGLLSIIGLHEFGHKAATRYHKLDATLPYFIPGPPPIGTFGALISLRGPPANRDQLFDLGLSGPAVGFAVTIAVGLLSMLFGAPLTQTRVDQLNTWFNTCSAQLGAQNCGTPLSFPAVPLILIILFNLAGSINLNVFPDQQLLFAAQIGALITFLNIVPAWQLDGGHISRAVFGSHGHRIATFIGLGILFYAGFWPFALLVLVMMGLSRRGLSGVEPLDDVSPVSNSRKILYLLGVAMLVLTFASSPFR